MPTGQNYSKWYPIWEFSMKGFKDLLGFGLDVIIYNVVILFDKGTDKGYTSHFWRFFCGGICNVRIFFLGYFRFIFCFQSILQWEYYWFYLFIYKKLHLSEYLEIKQLTLSI